ncbi:unnamed protein product (macronuclear) [Paramecium tetraurelia]|uniref:Uncharacterized protein n=1 Tax=Paramecium tetraurelia TaxID=5888 RepID=A0D8I3_PARTE|nr:uncharacterized protein GSPATT00014296001 [Paramecium tetraurelia]CAK79350.1 unnamed protein product [Paramecium tetraurelia]|eukprot:XP_001446747.1 hypothetical protein (macronuclear) [Paramecium tetraurelia strain d4-2]
MFCCSNAKKKSSQTPQKKQNNRQNSSEQTLNINDEALTFITTIQIQHINTIQTYKITQDIQTFRSSRSNSRGTKNNDHVAQSILVKPLRKSPFLTFNKKGTDTTTKYLSTKQGYTLLVTRTPQ